MASPSTARSAGTDGPGESTAPGAPVAPTSPNSPAKKPKRQPTPADMVRSLVVLLVPVIVIAWFFTRDPSDQDTVPTVQWSPVLAVARAQAPYPVLAPTSTPAGWRATRVSFTKAGEPDSAGVVAASTTWKLGFLTDQTIYVALVQADPRGAADRTDLVADASRDGVDDGTSTVAGVGWRRLVSDDGRTRSLVRTADGATSVVSGDTDYATLEGWVALLRT